MLTLAAAAPASADFYSYVDSSGVVHITNVPVSSEYKWMMQERDGATTVNHRRAYSNNSDFDEIIKTLSARYGIDPHLVKAIVKAESDFDPSAVSSSGARGLMQLMPDTAALMGVKDIHDPVENVEGGIRYLNRMLEKFAWKVPLAVAAYNAGETAVAKYGRIPPYSETQDYVKRVLRYYRAYKGIEK